MKVIVSLLCVAFAVVLSSAAEYAYPDLLNHTTEGWLRCSGCRVSVRELKARLAAKYPEDEGQAGELLESVCQEEKTKYGLKVGEDGVTLKPEFVPRTEAGVVHDEWIEHHLYSFCQGHNRHIDVQMIMTQVEIEEEDVECPCPGDEFYAHHDPFANEDL